MNNICKDLSTLTTVPLFSIEKLMSKFQDSICYTIQEELASNNNSMEIDIYIGKLFIEIIDDNIYYKFIPSKDFEADVMTTIKTGVCPLISKLEDSIQTKITRAYKELY